MNLCVAPPCASRALMRSSCPSSGVTPCCKAFAGAGGTKGRAGEESRGRRPMRPIEAARPMSLGFKVGSLGTLAPGLRPRVAGVEPEEADEDLILDDALFVVCFLSGESDSPKLSLSSMSGDATSMLPTIDETVGNVVAVVGSALQLPCETPDIAMTN